MELNQTLLSAISSTLLSTLSISFLVATFMLSEYLNHSDETPRKRRPFYIGSITMIIAVWLGAIGLGTFAMSGFGPDWLVGGAVLALGLQIILITGAVTFLGWKVLFD